MSLINLPAKLRAPRSRARAWFLGALSIAIIVACASDGIVAPPMQVAPVTLSSAANGQMVISQVYGGGGNTGATYKNDYIELYNAGSGTVNLATWSVQYTSATGSTWSKTNLVGSVLPGHYYLVQEAAGTAGTVSLPTPDAFGTIAMSATAGKVALVNNTTLLTGTGCPLVPGSSIVDYVGYGSTANCFEGTGATPNLVNTTAAIRNAANTDTDNNATDFTSAAPNPRNSSVVGTIVAGPLDHVAITGGATTVTQGASTTFTATGLDANNLTVPLQAVTWASSDPATATVDNTGKVTAVAANATAVTLTATVVANSITKTNTASITVTPPAAPNPAATVTVAPATASIKTGATTQLTASAKDAAGVATTTTYTWSSANDALATVDANGLVTGKGVGTVVITATSANGVAGTATITVTSSASLSLTSGKTALALGMQTQFFFSGTDASGAKITTVVWSSSDASIITVDQKGVVTAKAVSATGARVIATAPDGTAGSTTVTVYLAAGSTGIRLGHNTEFGEPKDADPSDDVIIRRPQYTVSYNPRIGGANWVSWNLDATHVGTNGRCVGTCYSADTALTNAGITAYTTADWVSNAAYDRGHMAPSADWTSSEADNNTTFFLSNFLPQTHDMNAGPWERLETALRDTVATGREAYIIAGGIFTNGVGLGTLLNNGKIGIPNSTWKVAVITPAGTGINADGTLPANTTVLAVNMPNVTGIAADPFSKYLTTVSAIEQATGYNLLALLAERVQCRVEVRNCPPTAHITGGVAGVEGQALVLDGSTSTDPDAGNVLSYQWSVDGAPVANTPTLSRVFADNGTYAVRLIAADQLGAADTTSVSVTITNAAPVIDALTNTSDGSRYGVSASFRDAGTADAPWSYTIDWGDSGSVSSGSVSAQGASIAADHVYARPGTYPVSAVVRDKDGAISAPVTTSIVVRDNTPPVVAYTVTGTEGKNGWYTGDVTVKWTAADGESALTSAGCPDNTLTTNSSGTVFTCSASSEGGTTTRSVTIKRDASVPVVTGAASGPLGSGGWYTGNVAVNWSATDDVSPVPAVPCAPNALTTDSDAVTYTCTAENEAGLTGTGTIVVKRDATLPTVTPTTLGTVGENGWYTSDVALSWAVAGSGPSGTTTSSSCAAQTLATDIAATAFTCTATTGAGLTTTQGVTIKRDATAPVVTPVAFGQTGAGGWYTGDVTVRWSATDGVAPVAAEPCAATVLAENSASITYSCTAKNDAGLSTTSSLTVKRDATVPTVTPTTLGTVGENGWYTSNVALSWAVAGSGPSGTTTSPSCAAQTLATDMAATAFTCTATTGAGLSTTQGVTIKRDATAPVLTPVASGPAGSGGWYTGNVTVKWSATDNTAPVAAEPCAASLLAENSAGTTYSCTAKNDAGLSTTSSVTVKRDDSRLVVTPTATGTAGTNRWYVSTVGLTWGITGAGPSGVTSEPSCAAQSLATDTPGTTFACTATTGAGIATSASISLKRDASPPLVIPSVSGATGDNGWYRGDATVSWSASDNVSTVNATPCAASTLGTDNTGVTYTCAATNDAGLTTTASQVLKRDATNPVIGYTGNVGPYTVDQTVNIACSASDATSGLATNTCANVTGAAYTFPLGITSYSATATDRAGNGSSASGSFTVGVTSSSLCTLLTRWIGDRGVSNSLCVKLSHGDYEPFRLEVRAQSGKKIEASQATILLALVNAL